MFFEVIADTMKDNEGCSYTANERAPGIAIWTVKTSVSIKTLVSRTRCGDAFLIAFDDEPN